MKTCEECSQFFDLDFPHYHHVHAVDTLPPVRRTDDHLVEHGYAVQFSGGDMQCLLFFHDREPALAFGCAARMAFEVTDYSVFPAAREERVNPRSVVASLHVTRARIDRGPDEHDDLARWLAGVSPTSPHFTPPLTR